MFPFFDIPAHATVRQGYFAVWRDNRGCHCVDIRRAAKRHIEQQHRQAIQHALDNSFSSAGTSPAFHPDGYDAEQSNAEWVQFRSGHFLKYMASKEVAKAWFEHTLMDNPDFARMVYGEGGGRN